MDYAKLGEDYIIKRLYEDYIILPLSQIKARELTFDSTWDKLRLDLTA